MEAAPQTPLMTTKTYLILQQKLLEIEAEIVQFTNLPTDTPCLDVLTKHIDKKIAFFKNLLTAETASHDSTSHELSEIEGKLEDLEAEFHESNPHSEIVHENDDSEYSSGSVCGHCSKEEPRVQREAGNDNWKVYENPTVLYEAMMSPSEVFHKAVMQPSEMYEGVVPPSDMFHERVKPPSEMIHEAVMPPSYLEDAKEVSFDRDREQIGGGKKQGRRWRRTLTVIMTVGLVSMVVVSSLINCNQDEGFLTPT